METKAKEAVYDLAKLDTLSVTGRFASLVFSLAQTLYIRSGKLVSSMGMASFSAHFPGTTDMANAALEHVGGTRTVAQETKIIPPSPNYP